MSLYVKNFFDESDQLRFNVETYTKIDYRLKTLNKDLKRIVRERTCTFGMDTARRSEREWLITIGVRWVVSEAMAKEGQRKIVEIVESDEIPLEKKGNAWTEVRGQITKCVVIFAYVFGNEIERTNLNDAYVALHLYLDNLELTDHSKRFFANFLQKIGIESLKVILAKLEKIEFSNSLGETNGRGMTASLQKLILVLLEEYAESPVDEILKWLDFVGEVVSSKKLKLRVASDIERGTSWEFGALLKMIHNALKAKEIHIVVMTCSDYEGRFIMGGWEFDFRSYCGLGRILCLDMARFASAFAKIADKYVDNVQLHHFLPTFEDSRPDYKRKFQESLERIRTFYSREVHAFLSSEWVADHDFHDKKESISDSKQDSEFTRKVLGCNTFRSKYHPELGQRELKQLLLEGASECLALGEILAERENTIFLSMDSDVLIDALTLKKVPFLAGRAL